MYILIHIAVLFLFSSYLIGVLANNGPLDTTAAIKGTHFIRLCDIRNVPMIFLQNTPSDEEFLSPTGNGGTTAKARGEMMSILSTVNVRLLDYNTIMGYCVTYMYVHMHTACVILNKKKI